MVQKIDLTGRVFRMLKENNLMIEKSQHSTPNQDKRYEEWMFDSGIPKVWSDYLDINDDDQLHGKGFPILRPIKRIADEENLQGEGIFRFPHNGKLRHSRLSN